MRRTVVLLTLLALAAPFAATAAMRAPGDGTLAVRGLDGQIRVAATGAIVGRCGECKLFVDERWESSTINPVVVGARGVDQDDDGDRDFYEGKNLRWRVLGGSFFLRVRAGKDVDVSVIGKGVVWIRGTAGSYTVNESDKQLVTTDAIFFPLRATTQP